MRLGRSFRDRLRIAAMFGHSHLRESRLSRLFDWLPARSHDVRELRLRSGLSVVGRRGDGTVFFEQFGLDVYDVAAPGPVRTIVDLGANVGYAALRLAARHPGARLVCAEPAAAARSLLEQNVTRNGLDGQVFGVAVMAEPGTYALEAAGHFGANRVRPAAGPGGVEGITLAELLDRAGVAEVDLLKVDIEGAERELFATASAWAPRVRSIVAELHGDFGHADAERALAPHGFRRLPLPDRLGVRELVLFTRDDATRKVGSAR